MVPGEEFRHMSPKILDVTSYSMSPHVLRTKACLAAQFRLEHGTKLVSRQTHRSTIRRCTYISLIDDRSVRRTYGVGIADHFFVGSAKHRCVTPIDLGRSISVDSPHRRRAYFMNRAGQSNFEKNQVQNPESPIQLLTTLNAA